MASDRPLRIHFAAALAVLLATAALPARAAELSPADRQTARALMDEGHAHRERGESREALDSFRAADALMHVPSTGIEVARSLVQLGRLLEAYEAALAVRRLPPREGEPAVFIEARRDADRMLDDLEARIPTLSVHVRGAADASLEVRVDGALLPAGSHEILRKLDPGRHEVAAASGARVARAEVTLGERERRDVALDLDAPASAKITEAPAPVPASSPAPITEASAPPPPRSHTLLYVGAGVGGAGLVVGAVTGLLALSHRDTARAQCIDDRCPPAVHDDVDAAHTFGTVSTVGFIVAGVGAGLAVFDLVRPRADGAASASVAVAPGGLTFRGSF